MFRPYVGRETVGALLGIVMETFEDFRYTDALDGDDGPEGLVFRTTVAGRELEGLDLLRLNADGRIADLTVMIRPLSVLTALAQAMGPKVEAAGLKPEPAA